MNKVFIGAIENKFVFKDGKAEIKRGKKVVAKIIDREKFIEAFEKKTGKKWPYSYSKKYPYSIEISGGSRECETLEECRIFINKYTQ